VSLVKADKLHQAHTQCGLSEGLASKYLANSARSNTDAVAEYTKVCHLNQAVGQYVDSSELANL